MKANDPVLTAHQARLIHLAAQGLLKTPRRRARKADVLAAIRRMRLLQIDTIHVVARSPYLVLFSRLGDYRREWLDALLADGAIFETWAHEASFAPSEDYPLHRRHAIEGRNHWAMKLAARMRKDHGAAVDALLDRVRAHGAVMSSDFERADGAASGGWWGWKTEKRLLEALFATGDLMIARRERFQRVYDVAERVLAKFEASIATGDDALPPVEAMRRAFIVDAVRALGVTQARWIADYFRMGRRIRDAELEPLLADGTLIEVEVRGWDAPGYAHVDHRALIADAAAGRLRATRTTLLSPFDPVVWDRERAAALFGFDYRLECYVPAPKRRFGYYVLPLLDRGRLIARIDAKAHRAEGVFEAKSVFLEEGVAANEASADAIVRALDAAARWHDTPTLRIGATEPRALKRPLEAAARAMRRRALPPAPTPRKIARGDAIR